MEPIGTSTDFAIFSMIPPDVRREVPMRKKRPWTSTTPTRPFSPHRHLSSDDHRKPPKTAKSLEVPMGAMISIINSNNLIKTYETLKSGLIHKFERYCNWNLNLNKYQIENSIIMLPIGTSTIDFAIFIEVPIQRSRH